MRTTAATAAALPLRLPSGRSRGQRPRGDAAQNAIRTAGPAVAQQRRGYARKVLAGLARRHAGQPARDIERQLSSVLTPLGVRLSAAQRHDLAVAIHHGAPVDLPGRG